MNPLHALEDCIRMTNGKSNKWAEGSHVRNQDAMQIYNLLIMHGTMTTKEIQQRMDRPKRAVFLALAVLEENKLVKRGLSFAHKLTDRLVMIA